MSLVPSGVVPNYVDPLDLKTQSLILNSIALTLTTGVVAMRIYTRLVILNNTGIDDYMIIFAWAASSTLSGLLIASERFGIGRHTWDIPPEWVTPGLKLVYVTELIYFVALLCVKLSFLLFFYRIFESSKSMRLCIYGAIIANSVFYTVIFFRTVFSCIPIEKFFNHAVKGTCNLSGPNKPMPYATGIWGSISDFFIFLLPIPSVWSMTMRTSRKIRVIAVFGLGLFACITSVIRLVITFQLISKVDTAWNYTRLSPWLVLEVDVGLVCVGLLTLPAFLDKHKPKKLNSFLLCVIPYISDRRSSGRGSNNSGPGTHEHENNLARGDGGILELGRSLSLPAHPHGYIKDHQNNVYSATVRRDKQGLEDIEALSLEEVSVINTVNIDNDSFSGEDSVRYNA